MRLTLIACLLVCSTEWSQTTKPAPQKKATTTKPTASAKVKAASKIDLELGKKLIESSDCETCHQPEGTLIGPGFKDVALKYPNTEANVIYLANKIKNGGGGVWGDNVMSPHSAFTVEECKKIARYVLSLNK